MPAPILELYRNIQTGGLLVGNFAPDGAIVSVAAGGLLHVSPDEFKNNGLSIILSHLREYPTRSPQEGSELNQMSSLQKRKLFLKHRILVIRLASPNLIEIGPYPSGGSPVWKGKQGAHELRLPATNEEFLCLVEKAFSFFDSVES